MSIIRMVTSVPPPARPEAPAAASRGASAGNVCACTGRSFETYTTSPKHEVIACLTILSTSSWLNTSSAWNSILSYLVHRRRRNGGARRYRGVVSLR